jgi:transposase-like protein
VFGGVERGSGKTFLVTVPDRTAETLIAVIKDWIESGTTVISDCWAAYRTVGNEGYRHQTVNHCISFVDPLTGAHTNTIESTWRHVKATLHPYNRMSDYMYSLSEYMFRKKCTSEGRDPFTKLWMWWQESIGM